jgi:hypothetical protein
MKKVDKSAVIAMSIFAAIMFLTALLTDGTCDEGDSVMHFLFAKYAFSHPENYFHHWAKPFYVIIMSPFAHFGFMSAKLFNTFLSCVAVWFTYLIAKELKLKWALAVFFIPLFFKTFVVVTLSGLTEPLNDALLAIALYLVFTGRYVLATVIMSFLPFVRSEGIFLCGTFSLYLLWIRQWKLLPLLLLGHAVYAIAGYPFHKDLLWVIHDIPYKYGSTHYGHGSWLHYITEMPMITGVLNCVLLSLGIIITVISSLYFASKKQLTDISVRQIFIVLIFLIFLAMHATFWALGIFGSFGLIRVFIAISCVMILIMVFAIDGIDAILAKLTTRHSVILILALAILYPLYARNNSPYSYQRYDLFLHADEKLDLEAVTYLKQKYPDYKNYYFYFDACYFGELLNVDVFDNKVYSTTENFPQEIKQKKCFVIWDDWYSNFEHNTSLKTLRENKQLRELKSMEKPDQWNQIRKVVLFVKD